MEPLFAEKSICLIYFAGILVVMGAWEALFQREKPMVAKSK